MTCAPSERICAVSQDSLLGVVWKAEDVRSPLEIIESDIVDVQLIYIFAGRRFIILMLSFNFNSY